MSSTLRRARRDRPAPRTDQRRRPRQPPRRSERRHEGHAESDEDGNRRHGGGEQGRRRHVGVHDSGGDLRQRYTDHDTDRSRGQTDDGPLDEERPQDLPPRRCPCSGPAQPPPGVAPRNDRQRVGHQQRGDQRSHDGDGAGGRHDPVRYHGDGPCLLDHRVRGRSELQIIGQFGTQPAGQLVDVDAGHRGDGDAVDPALRAQHPGQRVLLHHDARIGDARGATPAFASPMADEPRTADLSEVVLAVTRRANRFDRCDHDHAIRRWVSGGGSDRRPTLQRWQIRPGRAPPAAGHRRSAPCRSESTSEPDPTRS